MAIIQISKIQQRSGNLVDLPQLDTAQFGFASDAKLLFIGAPASSTSGNVPENVEVLTAYSSISLSQIQGSDGSNLNVSNAENGQVLTFDSSSNTWYNAGANSGGLINLGNASNVKIGGGASGYVLETDGLGNLGWTPKGAIVALIQDISRADPGVVTTQTDNPFTNGLAVTLSNILDNDFGTDLNGNTFYVKVVTSNSFQLFADANLSITVNTVSYSGNYEANSGRAVSSLAAGGGSGASGSNTTVQYNKGGILAGSGDFTFDDSTRILNLNGNIVSNNYLGGNYFDITGNTSLKLNANGNAVISVANQPNVVVVSTTGANLLGTFSVSGNVTLGNLNTTGIISTTSNITANNASLNGSLSVTGNASADNIIANSANVTGNISANNLSIANGMSVTGNVSVGNVTGNIGIFSTVNAATIGNVGATITGNGFTLSAIPAANLVGQVNLATQVTGTLPINRGGTGQTTATAAINALLPAQAGNAGKVLSTDGVNVSWNNSALETWVKNLINTIEPIGTIKAWAGNLANIPTGWALCNGANGTLNLTDRFIAAFGGGAYGQNGTGGWTPGSGSTPVTVNGTTTVNGSHSHGSVTALHTLSVDQIPSHVHGPAAGGSFFNPGSSGLGLATNNSGLQYFTPGTTGATGGSQGHQHGIFTDGLHNHTVTSTGSAQVPGFFALAFIQKIANVA